MSAQENLSPGQFMSVKELGNYQSMDYPDKTMNQVHRMFRAREKTSLDFRNYMTDLRGSIEDHGLQNPVFVNEEEHVVGNGHHRFSAMKSLRQRNVPVTHDMRDSVGDDD